MFILIITIPFGDRRRRGSRSSACGRSAARSSAARTPAPASLIGNVIWFVLAGWWLALGHLITGVAMCITIIGIPLGLANFKLIPVSLTPFGREIVTIEQAQRWPRAPRSRSPDDPPRPRLRPPRRSSSVG